jgi:homoserine dehydrogenase
VAQRFGDAGASIKSVVQQGGHGARAQLMLVTHPLPRSRLQEALAVIAQLDNVLAPPRAISVINEEFV